MEKKHKTIDTVRLQRIGCTVVRLFLNFKKIFNYKNKKVNRILRG